MDYIWIEFIMKKTINRFDEIEQIRRKKRRKVKTRRFLGLLVIVTIVAVTVLIVVNVMGEENYKKLRNTLSLYMAAVSRFPITYNNATPEKIDELGRGFAALNEETLIMYAQNGEIFSEIIHGMTSPDIASNETNTLLFARGSKEVILTNHSFIEKKWSTDNTIIDADLANDGTIAVLSDSERYTCELTVYDNETLTELFTWFEADGFPISVEITPNGNRAVVVTTRLENLKIVTEVTVIDLDEAKESKTFLIDQLPINVTVGQNEMYFVQQDKMLKYNFNGEVLAEYSFSNLPLINVSNDNSDNFALLFGDNNMSSINYVVVVDKNLKELTKIPDIGYVADMYINRNGLYILSKNTINEWSFDGKPRDIIDVDFGGINIFVDFDIYVFFPNRIEKI